MRTGRMYLLSRQTLTDGRTYEAWGYEGGDTGDVEHRIIPALWERTEVTPVIEDTGVIITSSLVGDRWVFP